MVLPVWKTSQVKAQEMKESPILQAIFAKSSHSLTLVLALHCSITATAGLCCTFTMTEFLLLNSFASIQEKNNNSGLPNWVFSLITAINYEMIIGSKHLKSSFQNQLRASTNLILTNSNFHEEVHYIYTWMNGIY